MCDDATTVAFSAICKEASQIGPRSGSMLTVTSAIVFEWKERIMVESQVWSMPENGAIWDTGRMGEAKMRTVQLRDNKTRCIFIHWAHSLRCGLDVVELKEEDWKMRVSEIQCVLQFEVFQVDNGVHGGMVSYKTVRSGSKHWRRDAS